LLDRKRRGTLGGLALHDQRGEEEKEAEEGRNAEHVTEEQWI
jgi:hypothetical protein